MTLLRLAEAAEEGARKEEKRDVERHAMLHKDVKRNVHSYEARIP